MGLDVRVLKFEKTYPTVECIPYDAHRLCLGKRDEIVKTVDSFFPGINWLNYTGIFDNRISGKGCSILFLLNSVDDAEFVDSFGLEIRSGSVSCSDSKDCLYVVLVKMLRQNGWQAIECAGTTFLDQDDELIQGIGLCFTVP